MGIERKGVGEREFPVWGDLFTGLEGGSPIERSPKDE